MVGYDNLPLYFAKLYKTSGVGGYHSSVNHAVSVNNSNSESTNLIPNSLIPQLILFLFFFNTVVISSTSA